MGKFIPLNQSQFLDRAYNTHGDTYDYSLSKYVGNNIKIVIICKIHGQFLQTPQHHMEGSGCPQCNRAGYSKKINYGLKFVERAVSVHGNKYDYSSVIYNGAIEKVSIICPLHGYFQQTPHMHLIGHGCPACGKEISRAILWDNTEKFINKSRKIHGDKYNYSSVIYTSSLEKVAIICPAHGLFYQKPHDHIAGSGCPDCKMSKGETILGSILRSMGVYFIREKSFPTCRVRNPMKFDFYVPQYNLLIEHHGHHHFATWQNKGNLLMLMKIRRNDEYKERWAIENNFTFISYSYKDSWAFIEKNIKKVVKSLEKINI